MSYIEELIKKYCPNGVEIKELQKISNIYTGVQLNKKNMLESGYPVINGGIKASGYTDKFNENENTITIAQGGVAGFVNFIEEKFWAGAHCYVIKISSNIVDNKFLFYVLKNIEKHIMSLKTGTTIFGLQKSRVEKIKIPLPPIEIQKEIVRILDSFTEKTNKLQEILQKENILRKKQYEYYRDELLTFDDNVEWKTLGECIDKTYNIKWSENKNKNFQYIDLSSVNRATNNITETQTINQENAPSRAQQIVLKDDIIFGTTRPMLKRLTIIPEEYNNQICSTGFCILRANKKLVLPKWILFIISTENFYLYVDKNQQGASYPAISDDKIKKYKIPVPTLEEQERIVNILDKFDYLCNSITKGIPREIELRKKQYEYYRERLLNFNIEK